MSDEKKDTIVEWSDEVKEKAAKDPELAGALREFGALVRQATAGVDSGQYKSFEDAMFILTGDKLQRVLPDEDNEEGEV